MSVNRRRHHLLSEGVSSCANGIIPRMARLLTPGTIRRTTHAAAKARNLRLQFTRRDTPDGASPPASLNKSIALLFNNVRHVYYH